MYRCLGFSILLSLCLIFCCAAISEEPPDALIGIHYGYQGQKSIGICLQVRPDNLDHIRAEFAALSGVPPRDVKVKDDAEGCALALSILTEVPSRTSTYFSDTLSFERLRSALREAGVVTVKVAVLLPTSPALVSGGSKSMSFAGGTRYEGSLNLAAPLPTWTVSYGWRLTDFILHGLFLLAPMAVVGTLVYFLHVHVRHAPINDQPAAVRVAAFVHTHVSLGFMLLWPCYVSLWSPLTWLVFVPEMKFLFGVALMIILPTFASLIFVAWLRAALFPSLSLLPEGRWTRAELWRQGAAIGTASLIPWILYTGPVFLDLMDLLGDSAKSLVGYGFFGALAAMVAYMILVPVWIGKRVGVAVSAVITGPVRQNFDVYWLAHESPPAPALYLSTCERGPVAAGLILPGSVLDKARAMRPGVQLSGRFAALAYERVFHMAVMRQSSRKTFSNSINGLIARGLYYPAMFITIGMVPVAYMALTDANGFDCFGDPLFVSGWLGSILGTALLCAFHFGWHSRRVAVRVENRLLEKFNDPATQLCSMFLDARCTALPLAWPVWCRPFLPCAPMARARHVALKGGLSDVDIELAREEADEIVLVGDEIPRQGSPNTSGGSVLAFGVMRMVGMVSITALGVGAILCDTQALPAPLPPALFLPVTALALACVGLVVGNRVHGLISARVAAKLRIAHPGEGEPQVPAIVGTSDEDPLTRGEMLVRIDGDSLKFRNGEEDLLITSTVIDTIHLVRSTEIFPLYAMEIAWRDPATHIPQKWHVLPMGAGTAHENNVAAARLALRLHAWFVNHTGNDSPAPTSVTTTSLKERLPRMLGSTFALLALGGYMGWKSPELLDPATTDFLFASLFVCTPLTIWCAHQLYRRWFETRVIAAVCDERE